MRSAIKFGICFAAFPEMAATAGSAAAQTTPTPLADASAKTAADQPDKISDIVVTAQRRSQRLQDIPVAVTAITGETLQAQRIESVTDLNRVVPALNVQRTTKVPVIYLRGVGNNSSSPGQEQNVAVYVDGVYYPSLSADVFAFDNLERIEVLKGPQGTLFGRNATGGVIQIVTKDPGQTFTGRVSAGYGNYNTYQASAFVSGGLADDVAANLSFRVSDQRNGWGHNDFNGGDVNRGKDVIARGKLVATPFVGTKASVTAQYSNSISDFGTSRQILPSTPTLPASFGGIFFDGNIYDRNANYPSRDQIQQYGAALRVDQKIGAINLVSISAYQQVLAKSLADVDQTPVDRLHVEQRDVTRSFSQELQLQSASSSSVQWVAGLFYFHAKAGNEPQRQAGTLIATSYRDIFGTQITDSYSAFGQATIPLFARTHITLGGRYTIDDKSIDGRIETPAGTSSATNGSKEWRKLDYRVGVDHRLSDTALIYATVATGFKSGVYNVVSITTPPVAPEELTAYEIGLKSDLFDRRLRFNVSGFYYDYRDLQLLRLSGASFIIQNAASARIYGAEVETVARVSAALTLTGGMSLLHSEYLDFPNAAANTPGTNGLGVQSVVDASGNRLQRTPDFTLNLGFTYKVPLAAGDLSFNGNIYRNGGFYWEPDNRLHQKGYNLVDGGMRWQAAGSGPEVQLWVKNLFQTKYYSYVTSSNGSPDTGAPGAPRTYGVSLGYRF